MKKIKVLIVDDSAFVRKILSQAVSNEKDMEVVGTAPDPYVARDKLVLLKPDVMTLDIEMPRMDGLTFLGKVMHFFPIPTIIVSSITKKGCSTSLEALEIGAVNVVPKPDVAYSIKSIEHQLIQAIRAASRADVKKKPLIKKGKTVNVVLKTTNKILAIGASTGGTEAIKSVLSNLPATIPGTVIVQHMPAMFTKAFAERLNKLCPMEVREAKNRDQVIPGVALIAPGDYHMVLRRDGANYFVALKKGPQVWHQRPAVDVLFNSVAKFAGANSVGVILTGMGYDGAAGMVKMKETGAVNIGQDEKSSVVYGMPRAAYESNALNYVEPLANIPSRIINVLNKLK